MEWMMKMKTIRLLVIWMGMASVVMAQSAKERKQNIRAAEAACGEPNVRVRVQKGQPPATPVPIADGKARVYIIESTYDMVIPMLLGVSFPPALIGMDGKWVGATKNNTYIVLSVAPGEHHFCFAWKPKFGNVLAGISLAEFSAASNQTYYLLTPFVPVNDDEAKLLLTNSVPVNSQITMLPRKVGEKMRNH